MPLPDRIGYADLYEVAPTSAIDRSGVRPLNEWMEILNGVHAGYLSVQIGDTPPASPYDGSFWWQSSSGRLFIRYNDGNSTQWCETVGRIAGDISAGLVTATGGGTKTLADWMAVIDPLAAADGDAQQMFTASAGQVFDIRLGTASAPDTVTGPGIKVTRTMAMPASLGGSADFAEMFAAISGTAAGVAGMVGQPVGVVGLAKNSSGEASIPPGNFANALGIWGFGQVWGACGGVALGGYFGAQIDNAIGNGMVVQVQMRNWSGVAGAYAPTGTSYKVGMYLSATGNAKSGPGIVIDNESGQQFQVGLAFGASVSGSHTGGVEESSIRDDSTSLKSLDVRGSHSYGLTTELGTFSQSAIRLGNAQTIKWLNAAGNADLNAISVNSSNSLVLGAGTTSIFVSSTLGFSEGVNLSIGTATGTKFGVSTSSKIGFYNKTPVIQPTVGAALSTGGAETNTNLATRINDIRTALVNLGLVA